MRETNREKIIRIEEKLDGINEHLKQINGSIETTIDKTEKNTGFRKSQEVMNKFIFGVLTVLLISLISIIVKSFI